VLSVQAVREPSREGSTEVVQRGSAWLAAVRVIPPILGSFTGELEPFEENAMSLGTILLIVLLLMLVGALPTWPHSRSWGYGPTGGLGLVLIIVLVLLLMGQL
jgi:hypothetical protein